MTVKPIETSIAFGPARIVHTVYGAGETYEANYHEVIAGEYDDTITKEDAIAVIRFMMRAFNITAEEVQ